VLYCKRGLRTYIQAHVRVQDPQTLSEALKIAECAALCAKDHHLSHHNDRYGNPLTNHHTCTSEPGPSYRGPTPMEIGSVEITKSNTSEISRKYNKSPAELNVMRRQGLCFKCGKKGHTVANCSKDYLMVSRERKKRTGLIPKNPNLRHHAPKGRITSSTCVRSPFFVGNMKRHKLASLLPT
jgi:Zinc knuckle